MPVIDGFYGSSNEVALYPDGAGTSSNTPDAFHLTGAGLSFNVDPDVAGEPFLLSLSPDPATLGNILTLTGVSLNRVRSVIIDGLGREFTIVNPTTITVLLPLMTLGPKTVHVEYV